jgi:membrane-associated protease RseP (regulator of RpoE activity)
MAAPAARLSVGEPAYFWYALLNDLLWVNFYWGLVNLLPVFPLDGGHAAQAVLEQHDPYRGRRKALMLSAAVAGVMAALGAVERNLYMLLAFVVLAVSSLQALEETGSRAPRPYRR